MDCKMLTENTPERAGVADTAAPLLLTEYKAHATPFFRLSSPQTTDPRHEPWEVRYAALQEFVVSY